MARGLILLSLLCAVLAVGPFRLAAQTTSIIQGTVTDEQHLAVVGAAIILRGPMSTTEIQITTDAAGSYRIAGLLAGTYDLRVAKPGFADKVYHKLTVTVNRLLIIDVVLAISTVKEEVTVSGDPPLFETTISSSGTTILPRQIEQMPINGRNYLDLMQLVPGVAVNRQVDVGSDAAVPILGERGGNTIFMIDGMPNKNAVDGGSAAPFDQDSILEFQILTAGYTAEFGHGSGGVVNVVSKSGANQWHGLLTGFHRNNAFDSSDVAGKGTPFPLRWDTSANAGGPVIKDRAFIFGSLERIREIRQLNFNFPANIPDFLQVREETFDQHNQTFETRSFLKLDEQLGRHHVTQQINLINAHATDFLPLSQATSLPSTRTNSDSRFLMSGFHDTATLGSLANPLLMNAYFQYRGEPFSQRATHPDASPATTLFNLFSSLTTGGLTGDLGQVRFGAGFTPLLLQPHYTSTGTHFDKVFGKHEFKFGWDFQHAAVDGVEASNLLNQLFATTSNFGLFGPVNSGVYVLSRVAGPTPADNSIHLRDNYNGLFTQDDWKIAKTLTLNLGIRWDYDSRFPNHANFSPRLGVAWSPTPKTVVTASWGMFYDTFRIGLARDVPGFGGANLFTNQTVCFPRNTAVSQTNVQALTGLDPQQFADAASAAVAKPQGFFFWGGFGNLTMNFPVPQVFQIPITVDPGFKTPYTRGFHLGVQREITSNSVIQADFYHRDIRNMLGVRTTNLAFEARIPGHAGELRPGTGSRPILSYGPWYQGTFDSVSVGIRKRMSKRFTVEAFYTWADAIDNSLRSSFVSDVQTGLGAGALGGRGPTDSFVGIPTLVTDPATGQTNANGRFIASNGNPVPQAGKF